MEGADKYTYSLARYSYYTRRTDTKAFLITSRTHMSLCVTPNHGIDEYNFLRAQKQLCNRPTPRGRLIFEPHRRKYSFTRRAKQAFEAPCYACAFPPAGPAIAPRSDLT